uniref:Vesicle transport protein n=1 Tax=Erpetoichthys calabaricus TaxID=27687 RepID=A0A8C4RMV3_ERPCA
RQVCVFPNHVQSTEFTTGRVSEATTLGWGTRVKGFIACFVLGVLCSVMGVIFLWIPGNGLTLFAVFYTFGNITSVCSTLFLMGPMKQLKKMVEPTRAIATAVMLVSDLFLFIYICHSFKCNICFNVLIFTLRRTYEVPYDSVCYDAFIKRFLDHLCLA